MRLINADTLREDWLHNGINKPAYSVNDILDSIDYAPTVDAERITHGHWETRENALICSACGTPYFHMAVSSHIYKYCAVCGTKMDGKDLIRESNFDDSSDDRKQSKKSKLVKWTSVADRLPEKSGQYLVFSESEFEECGVMQEYYDIDMKGFFNSEMVEIERITHWMPLPEPPRKDGEQK